MADRPSLFWRKRRPGLPSWRVRIALLVLLLAAGLTVWMTNTTLTSRFTEATRNRAELRLVLYSGNLVSELRRNAIVPQLLARDPALIGALNASVFSQSSERLISLNEEIKAPALTLLDRDGLTVASTEEARRGQSLSDTEAFTEARRSDATIFTVERRETGDFGFTYSRRVESGSEVVGVIVVEVDLARFELAWKGVTSAVFITDSDGTIILSTEPRWRGLTPDEALTYRPPENVLERAFQGAAGWTAQEADAYLEGEALMRVDGRVPFSGWSIASFSTYSSVREKVNAVLALEIMGFALLVALGFYALSRKTALRMAFFQRDAAELRQLNARLSREIAERERMQKSLAVAEQTLAQSSKLAALGEMSAAVSHELNQPLAAMKTYLAGAKLLLRRGRPDEAQAAFSRIDDLIERMSAITKQLKSSARKGQAELSPVDMSEALAGALSMMEPQLKARRVKLSKILPEAPVRITGDRMRIEQVLINLLRNALDATKSVSDPQIEILLAAGDTVALSVRDNGQGIEDLESLFEPFYTTKQPGDGVGLGLAISSSIVAEHGGRLTARNGEEGGAVFELQLPILKDTLNAAE